LSVPEQDRRKRRLTHDVLDEVHGGDVIVVPTGVAEPSAILNALSERRHGFRDVVVAQILPLTPFGYLDPNTTEHVRHVSYFLGGASRPGAQGG